MQNDNLNDFADIVAAKEQFDYIQGRIELFVKQMAEASKAAKINFDSLADTSNLDDLVKTTKATAEANKTVAISLDGVKAGYEKVNVIMTSLNGHSKEYIDNLKGVEQAEKIAAQAATERTKATVLLSKEQDRQSGIQQKRQTQLEKEQSAYGQLNKQYLEAAKIAKDLGAQYVLMGQDAATLNEEQAATFAKLPEQLSAAQVKASELRETLFGINKTVGDFRMDVGNYPRNMAEFRAQAAAPTAGANLSGPNSGYASSAITATSALKNVNAELERMAVLGQQDTAEFKEMAAFAAELKAEIASVGIAIQEAGAKTEAMALGIEKIGENLKEVGKFALAFFGVQAGLEFISGISEAFEKANTAANQLQNTLNNAGNGQAIVRINEQVDELTKKFGYLKDFEVKGLFDQLITYGKLSEDQMKDLIPVIVDFSAKQRVSLHDGAETIIKALEGSGKALKAYGVNIKDATAETETAASPAERLSLVMSQLKPRVEGATAAFSAGFEGRLGTFKKDLEEIQLGIANFFVKLSGIEEANFKNAVAAKQEADAAQKLVAEYDELSKKVNQTSADKERLTAITQQLGNMFGNSVVSIDEETGALTLNIQATKDLITQKLLLANQSAAEQAQKFNAADEDKKQAAEQIALLQKRYEAQVKLTGETAEQAEKKIAYTKGGRVIDNLTPDETDLLHIKGNLENYQKIINDAVDRRAEALDKLKKLGFSEADVNKLFNPDKPIDTRSGLNDGKGKKTKDTTDETLKNAQELTKELYDEYAKRLQMEAEYQKAISEDESKSLEERLNAYRRYSELAFEAQEAPISAQYDQLQQSLAAIEKIEAKSADKRTQQEKDLMARKAVILQQFNNVSAEYDLIRAQDIDKTAKGIVNIQQDEVKKRLDAVKNLTENVDLQEGAALKTLTDSLVAGTIEYDDYTKQKKAIEDKFQKEKETQIRDYLQGEIDNLSAQGISTIQLQQQLNVALKALYDADAQSAIDSAKKKADAKKELGDKEWEAASEGIKLVQSLFDASYQKQLQQEQKKLDLVNENKQAQINAVNESLESEQAKQMAVAVINQQAATEQKAIQQEQNRIKREQAIADRVAALLGVVEGVAKGEAANAVNFADPVTLPYALGIAEVIAGIGLAQTAAILATPLPAYGFGTEDHPGGRVILGDRFAKELVIEPGKAPYMSADKPTIYDLAPHTRVIPQEELIANGMGFMTPSLLQGLNVVNHNDNSRLESIMEETADRMEQAIKNMPQPKIVMSNGEWKKSVRRGNSWTTYLNKNFK